MISIEFNSYGILKRWVKQLIGWPGVISVFLRLREAWDLDLYLICLMLFLLNCGGFSGPLILCGLISFGTSIVSDKDHN